MLEAISDAQVFITALIGAVVVLLGAIATMIVKIVPALKSNGRLTEILLTLHRMTFALKRIEVDHVENTEAVFAHHEWESKRFYQMFEVPKDEKAIMDAIVAADAKIELVKAKAERARKLIEAEEQAELALLRQKRK